MTTAPTHQDTDRDELVRLAGEQALLSRDLRNLDADQQHDLLAKLQLPKDADIGTFVTKQVQTRPHIRDTFTVITFSPFLPSKK